MSDNSSWIRTFIINGKTSNNCTYRTPLIQYHSEIKGKTVIDVGAGDGYESRTLSLLGAENSLAVEGKKVFFDDAVKAKEFLGVDNQEIKQLDVRKIDEFGLGKFDLVLCFGLLYHMSNPLNLLKRLKNLTGNMLFLETHVAPTEWKSLETRHKWVFSFDRQVVEMDGIKFEGKIVKHKGQHVSSKGSIDENWTFWMNIESLIEALILAGFQVCNYYYEVRDCWPEEAKFTAKHSRLGKSNSKIFLVCRPLDDQIRPVQEPGVKIIEGSSDWQDSPRQKLRRSKLIYGTVSTAIRQKIISAMHFGKNQ